VIPTSFKTPRALAALNISAVGLALSSVVGAIIAGTFDQTGLTGALGGAPTLLVGLAWAWLLRDPRSVGNSPIRRGWVASIPLAMLNAALTAALLFGFSSRHVELIGILALAAYGATLGAIIWIPALVATLLCFGLPIAWAQRLAKKGLAGAERGEWIVGLACVVMSAVGLLIAFGSTLSTSAAGDHAIWAPRALGILGALAGATSTGLAWAREARRRAFVNDAAAGKLAGYRIDSTAEGKVLIRVVAQGKGYRVADFEEEIFELDAEGEATRPKHLDDAGAA
jgi:hypothetical protein